MGYEGLIGNTPMVKLQSLSAATGCDIFVKVCLPCAHSAHSSFPDPFGQSLATFEISLLTFHLFQTIPTFFNPTDMSCVSLQRYLPVLCMPNDFFVFMALAVLFLLRQCITRVTVRLLSIPCPADHTRMTSFLYALHAIDLS